MLVLGGVLDALAERVGDRRAFGFAGVAVAQPAIAKSRRFSSIPLLKWVLHVLPRENND
jgi:hypothetical protein